MKNSEEFSHINTYAPRPPLRLEPIAEEPRLHRCGCAHPSAWNWRKHGDFQRRECGFAEGAAVSRAGPHRDVVDGQSVLQSWISRTAARAARPSRLAQPGALFRTNRFISNQARGSFRAG